MKYILSLDQGTSSSRAIVFDNYANSISIAQKETRLIYPKAGWVEQDPEEIWQSQINVAIEAIKKAKLEPKDISAIGITNQRESIILWDKKSGQALYNAIIWQDLRTVDICNELLKYEDTITKKTGLIIHPYFSASKIKWLIENNEKVKRAHLEDNLLIGTIDTWLLYKLTGSKCFATEHTNASRTMLYNINENKWDDELLNIFGISKSSLPNIQDSCSEFGIAEVQLKGIPICGIAGDQQAALLGNACIKKGMIKNTYGTGCFMLMNTGEDSNTSKNKLLKTCITQKNEFALEGSVFTGGEIIKWLRDKLGIISSSSEVEEIANKVPDSAGVYIVPAFNGLGAPYWDINARGIISGLTASISKEHIVRASLESMAYQSMDLIFAMEKDSSIKINELRVDGGASVNDTLLQFQANILQIPVIRPKISETTALGAAFLAGLGSGIWSSLNEIENLWKSDKTFEPNMNSSKRDDLIDGWNNAIKKCRV